jgi:enoyl-CoA hydratase
VEEKRMADFRIQERGKIIECTLDRPKKYNALTLEMLEGLVDATHQLSARDDLQVLLVRATGKYFSAGIDLNSALAPDPSITSPSAFRRWYRSGVGCIHPLGDLWEASEKPIVVAHQGPCLGGALEVSLCADFRLASDAAVYGLPEIAMGGLPGSGGTSRLARIAGPHWARWMVLGGQNIDANRALSIGIIHDVYSIDAFDARVDAFCDHMANTPREAFAAGKLAIELTTDLGRAEARNVERLAVSGLVTGDEYRTTVDSYMARFKNKAT